MTLPPTSRTNKLTYGYQTFVLEQYQASQFVEALSEALTTGPRTHTLITEDHRIVGIVLSANIPMILEPELVGDPSQTSR